MNWVEQKYKRYKQIQRHRAGEKVSLRGKEGTVTRLYLSDWAVMSRFEVRRQEKRPDHAIRWMKTEPASGRALAYSVFFFVSF